MAQPLARDEQGNIWDVSDPANPKFVSHGNSPLASPTLPYQAPQAATNLQRSQVEARIATDTAAAQEAKAKADAEAAQIAAKTAQEQWAINHPSEGSTASMSGPQYLQYLQKTNPGRAAYIQGLAEGRIPFPSAQMMRSPAGQALLTDVMRADPTIDATNYATRAAARKNAAVGGLGQSDNALITAVGHAARLKGLVPDVFGGPVTPLNSIANEVDSHLLSGKQPAYDQNAQLLGDEVAAAYGTNSQGKQNEAGAQFSSSLSAKQKMDNIHGAIDLLASKLAANRAQFVYGNGGLSKPDFMLLPAQTREELMSVAPDVAQKYFAGVPSMPNTTGGGGTGGGTPTGGTPPLTAPPGTPASSTDGFSETGDPQSAAFWEQAARSGTPYSQALSGWQQMNAQRGVRGDVPAPPSGYQKAVDWYKTHPADPQPLFSGISRTPMSMGDQLISNVAGSAPGVFTANAMNAATAGLPVLAAGDKGQFYQQYANSAHPGAAFAGDLAGTVAGAVGANHLLKGASVALSDAPVIGKAARGLVNNPGARGFLANELYGGTYGAASNPDHPLEGAAIGAGTAAAGDAVARFLLAPVGRAVGGKAAGMFGYRPPVALNSGESAIVKPVFGNSDALSGVQQNLTDAANLNLPYSLADSNPQLRALAGSAARKSPDVMELGNTLLNPRALGQADRTLQGISTNLAQPGDLKTMIAEARSKAQQIAQPHYEQAFNAEAPNDPRINDVLRTPDGEEAVRRAYRIALNRGESPADLSFSVDSSGEPIINASPNWKTLHYTKMGLDSLVEDKRDPVTGALNLNDPWTQSVNMLRGQFRGRLGELNPAYAKANQVYSDAISNGSAAEGGYGAAAPGVTPTQAQLGFGNQTEANAPFFQRGYASNMADTVNNTRFTANPMARIYGSPAQQAKVASIFPNGASNFGRLAQLENDMSATRNEVLGGSQTAARTQADKMFDNIELGNAAMKGIMSGGTSIPFDMAEVGLRKAGNGVFNRMSAAKAAQIGPLLLNQDPTAANAALNDMIARNAAYRRYLTATGNAGGLFGSAAMLPLIPQGQ